MEIATKKHKEHKEEMFSGRTFDAKWRSPGESLELRNPLILCLL
jgi:hypothetical protein